MRSRYLVLLFPLLLLALAGTSYAWQGRMGGMGDPFGLVADEADYLIHPAKIAKGEGVRFYGDYRFTYTGVTNWDYNLDQFNPAGALITYNHFNTSGQEYKHNALLGAAFPLGAGRMGLFFQYDGIRGDYDGNEDRWISGLGYSYYDYNLTRDLDNFALRLLYGLPIGVFKLGGEAQFSYRQEENGSWMQATDNSVAWMNWIVGQNTPEANLLPFQFPYDSSYWQALLKGSLEGKVGPLDLEFTLRGGFIFGGDNSLEMAREFSGTGSFDIDGDVKGWQIGGDLWLRYPLAKDLSLPFLVKVDYQEKSRDGDGPGMGGFSTLNFNYENEESDLQIAVGGGVDKELGAGTRIAGGLYYNYLQGNKAIKLLQLGVGAWTAVDSRDYPEHSEHQVIVRLAGEHEFTPAVAMRMGLGFFYGWAGENFVFTQSNSLGGGFYRNDDISLDGYRWGLGASLGGTIKFKPITLEPFINFGYQQLHLKGDGDAVNSSGVIQSLYEMSKDRDEWSIGGGLSVLFDL